MVIVKTESVELNENKEITEEPVATTSEEEVVNDIQNTEQQGADAVNEPSIQVDSTDLINGEPNKEIESTKTEKTSEENSDGTLNDMPKSDPDGLVQSAVPAAITPAASSVTAPAAATVSPSSSFQHHKTSLTHYNKPVYSSYRQNAAAMVQPIPAALWADLKAEGLLPPEARKALATPLVRHGVAANRATLDAAALHSVEQGLTSRRMAMEEIFAPSTIEL